ncbi:MAG: hypothetical protein IKC03_06905 [Oscillospiraceae bacterium]|nr:hypothetical protein [Oscillospiraceae bacterium]
MPRYFTRGTSLYALEQEMMRVPHPERTLYSSNLPRRIVREEGYVRQLFRYDPESMNCKVCMHCNLRKACRLSECLYLEERVEAGIIDLEALLHDRFSEIENQEFQERLWRVVGNEAVTLFLHQHHRERFTHYLGRYFTHCRWNMAALYLFTAYFDLWRRVIWKIRRNKFDFVSMNIRGIKPAQYSVYHIGKQIASGDFGIPAEDLASPEIIPDEAFRLIIYALLIAQYGSAILCLDENRGDGT